MFRSIRSVLIEGLCVQKQVCCNTKSTLQHKGFFFFDQTDQTSGVSCKHFIEMMKSMYVDIYFWILFKSVYLWQNTGNGNNCHPEFLIISNVAKYDMLHKSLLNLAQSYLSNVSLFTRVVWPCKFHHLSTEKPDILETLDQVSLIILYYIHQCLGFK